MLAARASILLLHPTRHVDDGGLGERVFVSPSAYAGSTQFEQLIRDLSPSRPIRASTLQAGPKPDLRPVGQRETLWACRRFRRI